MVATTFHGTEDEYYDLMVSVGHNCGCEHSDEGLVSKACGAHVMLAEQRALDGLVWQRREVARLLEKEMSD